MAKQRFVPVCRSNPNKNIKPLSSYNAAMLVLLWSRRIEMRLAVGHIKLNALVALLSKGFDSL